MVSQWAVLMWLYTLEHICGDKKQVKRDFMELKKYLIMITRFSKNFLIKDDQDSASTLVT